MRIRKIVAFALSFLILVQAPISTLANTGNTLTSVVLDSATGKEQSDIQFFYGTIDEESTDKEIIWDDFPESIKAGETFYITLGLNGNLEYDLADADTYIIIADNASLETAFPDTSNRPIKAVTPLQPGSLCIQAYLEDGTQLVTEKVLSVESEDPAFIPNAPEPENGSQDDSQKETEEKEAPQDDRQKDTETTKNTISEATNSIINEERDNETEITLNYYAQTLIAGEKFQLEAYCSTKEDITFQSSSAAIATVSDEGLVTAVNIGTCTITAKTETAFATCNITVNGDLTISKSTVTLYVGQTQTLQADSKPKVREAWSSSAANIADITQAGIITAKKAGETVITVSANGLTKTCRVIVKNKTLNINKSRLTAYVGYKTALQATATPSAKVTFRSTDSKKATIDSKGTITPKKTGQVKITATGNGITKTCIVTIKNPSLKLDSKIYIFENNIKQITAKTTPAASVKWKSSNSRIASVDKNGLVKGVKSGKTTITVTHGKIKKSCEVQVLKNTYKLNRSKSTLTKGDSVKLYMKNVGADEGVSFFIDSGSLDAVSISSNGNLCTVKAEKAGTVKIRAVFYQYIDGFFIECSNTATVTVTEAGISPQQCSVALGLTKTFKVKNTGNGKSVASIAWSSSNRNIASIDSSTGLFTAKKTGTTTITANITYTDNTTEKHTTTAKVSDPKLKTAYKTSSGNTGYKIGLKGTNSDSSISWKSNKTYAAKVGSSGHVSVYSYIPQKVRITATVDGKNLSHQLIITNPSLKQDYQRLSAGSTKKIKVTGVNSKSKITYKSKNPSIASVTRKGVVTARRNGNASIEVSADGKKMIFTVHVIPKTVINYINKAESIMYSSTYSQAYRMSQGYYDCSSLIFRAYGADGPTLLGGSSWAPTAAAQAWYLESRGKAISYSSLDISDLRPGDLIFYGGGSNGRYKNIYHVSMYYGGGYRLEKPLRYYYPSGDIVLIARPVS